MKTIKNTIQIYFITKRNEKKISMSYYTLPEDILENSEELDIWINKSLKVKKENH